ncbi:MAG: hypothetical protein AABM67_16650 [Acidobacteriota bacterium]
MFKSSLAKGHWLVEGRRIERHGPLKHAGFEPYLTIESGLAENQWLVEVKVESRLLGEPEASEIGFLRHFPECAIEIVDLLFAGKVKNAVMGIPVRSLLAVEKFLATNRIIGGG